MDNPLKKYETQCRAVLETTTIGPDGPGTIRTDVETLMTFIGETGIVTGSEHGNLPADVLPEINGRLAAPLEVALKRALLRDYPNIAGVFVLLRVMGLAEVKDGRVRINLAALGRWRVLNLTEQYFALLEAWLLLADEKVLGGAEWREARQFEDNVSFLTGLPSSKWKEFHFASRAFSLWSAPCTWNTQLHARFGLIEIGALSAGDRNRVGRGWLLGKARLTPWGRAVAWAIIESLGVKEGFRLMELPEDEQAGFGTLHRAFERFFAEWRMCFAAATTEARTGIHLFKVTMSDRRADGVVWRRLAVPHDFSLDSLADAVLDAFGFSDREHLYGFTYRDETGRGREYAHPYDEEAAESAGDIAVGELGLPDKGVIKFRFDYGASWRFELKLERIDAPGGPRTPVKVLAAVGKAPQQYGTERW